MDPKSKLYKDTIYFVDTSCLETTQNEVTGQKHYRLKNFLLDILEKKTQNGTWYSRDMLPLETLRNQAKAGALFSYMDHTFPGQPPSDGNRVEKITMSIDSLEWKQTEQGLEIYADSTVLNEGQGKIIGDLLSLGKTIGFSKRGTTEKFVETVVNEVERVLVPTPYIFHAWDTVTGQSVAEAQTSISNIAVETLNPEPNKETQMSEKLTLAQVKADESLWSAVVEAVTTERADEIAKLVNTKVKDAKESLQTDFDAKLQPVTEAKDALTTALQGIGDILVKAKIVDVREATEKETELKTALDAAEAKVTTLETENSELKQKITAPAPAEEQAVDEKVMETFFSGKPGGTAVMEKAVEAGLTFKDVPAMESHYASVVAFSKSVLGTTNPLDTKGIPAKETTDVEMTDEQKRAERQRRAGKK